MMAQREDDEVCVKNTFVVVHQDLVPETSQFQTMPAIMTPYEWMPEPLEEFPSLTVYDLLRGRISALEGLLCPPARVACENRHFTDSFVEAADPQHPAVFPMAELTHQLARAIPSSEGGLLSVGSLLHQVEECKPCLFFHHPLKECKNGTLCLFCHYEHPKKHSQRPSEA